MEECKRECEDRVEHLISIAKNEKTKNEEGQVKVVELQDTLSAEIEKMASLELQ